MRLFYFENEKGERKPLNAENGVFLYEPSGLGIEFDNTYSDSSNGFFMRTKKGVSQLGIEFSLYFLPDAGQPYDLYRTLVNWFASSEELFFVYNPYGEKEFYRKVEIASIEKEEISKEGPLICRTSLLPLTPWYLPGIRQIALSEESEHAMRYPFYWTDNLVYAVGSTSYSAQVETLGHIPAAVKITWQGAVIDPVIYIRGYDSREIYGRCSISGTFLSSDKIILSTAEQDSYIIKVDARGNETDLLDSIDITSNPFFRIPVNELCEIVIDGDNIIGSGRLYVYDYYRGV